MMVLDCRKLAEVGQRMMLARVIFLALPTCGSPQRFRPYLSDHNML